MNWMVLPLSGLPPLRCSVMVMIDADGPMARSNYERCQKLARMAEVQPAKVEDASNDFRLRAYCPECWEIHQRS